jgi:ABC-type Mn2+/Zn2+ transport system ATPase subunit
VSAVVDARGLAVGYGGVAVVDGIDLVIDEGSLVALVGTNGSGKSTLLRTLVGLLPPVGGSVRVLGAEPGARPQRVAYLSQFHAAGSVLPLRARAVVRMGRFAEHGLVGRMTSRDDALVDEALERMDIAALADRAVRDLSGGQRQRTYLAQVLARRADLLVLDEPTAGLDLAGQELYEQAVREERARGATVVVATHDIGEAARADHVVLLAGRVVASGSPGDVLGAERLLETFGIALRGLGEGLVLTEQAHGHEHDHGVGDFAHGAQPPLRNIPPGV